MLVEHKRQFCSVIKWAQNVQLRITGANSDE